MHESGISIWFFIGLSLLVNGVLITGAGIWEFLNPPAVPTVVLFHLHANIGWGGISCGHWTSVLRQVHSNATFLGSFLGTKESRRDTYGHGNTGAGRWPSSPGSILEHSASAFR